jgi:hypothetical protein
MTFGRVTLHLDEWDSGEWHSLEFPECHFAELL